MITLRHWQKTIKNTNDLIVQASSVDGQDRWQIFPIGMQYSYLYSYKKGNHIQIGEHEKTVLCAITKNTDQRRRPVGLNRQLFLNNLERNGIKNIIVDQNDYFISLPSHKFVISPEGNGIDCHRHYESLIAGSIPIIEYNEEIEKKYKNCPILYTKDYSEITEEYLLKKYNEMIDIEYDFAKLFLSFYSKDTQQSIKNCGNFWMKRCTNTLWYT